MRGNSQEVASEFAAVIQEAVNVSGVAKITVSPGDRRHEFGLTVNRDEGLVRGPWHCALRMPIQVVHKQQQDSRDNGRAECQTPVCGKVPVDEGEGPRKGLDPTTPRLHYRPAEGIASSFGGRSLPTRDILLP